MKTDIDIKNDIWRVIKKSPLFKEVTGELKKTSVRPKESRKEDIVISILANNIRQKQMAYVNVNIYVADNYVDGQNEENSERLRRLCNMAFSVFENVRGVDFRLSLTDPNFDCGQRVI